MPRKTKSIPGKGPNTWSQKSAPNLQIRLKQSGFGAEFDSNLWFVGLGHFFDSHVYVPLNIEFWNRWSPTLADGSELGSRFT